MGHLVRRPRMPHGLLLPVVILGLSLCRSAQGGRLPDGSADVRGPGHLPGIHWKPPGHHTGTEGAVGADDEPRRHPVRLRADGAGQIRDPFQDAGRHHLQRMPGNRP
ncbi:hypothetical protein ACIF70_42850 [Actinacidiphila glaucinigra]|uniref:hypothetical protein n=1 Tax=Actinacidiphila glaucinigra TaxID=235986 RepID=UPI0037CCBAA7